MAAHTKIAKDGSNVPCFFWNIFALWKSEKNILKKSWLRLSQFSRLG